MSPRRYDDEAGDTGEQRVEDHRRPTWRVGEIRNNVTTLLQIGALIYGIAKFTTGMDALKEVVSELRIAVNAASANTNRVEIQQARDQGRIDAIEGMLKAVPRLR